MRKWIASVVVFLLGLAMLAGCGKTETEERIADLDFTVMEEAAVPVELQEIVEGKKSQPFKLTYSDSRFLYLVVGYGEQPTGGYSIQVNDLYLTENSIYLDADLLGPEKGEAQAATPTYPWIAIKLEYRPEKVIFDT